MQRRMLGEGNQVQTGEAQLWWGEAPIRLYDVHEAAGAFHPNALLGRNSCRAAGISAAADKPAAADLHLHSRPQIKPCCKHSDPRLGASIGLIRSGDFTAADSSQAPLGPSGSLAPPRLGLAYPFSNTSTLRRCGVGIGRSGRSWTR
jgi:hypothetical protein